MSEERSHEGVLRIVPPVEGASRITQRVRVRVGSLELQAVRKVFLQADLHGQPMALNSFAWFLVTASEKSLRDPRRALDLAKLAVTATKEKDPAILDTLAEAYHANGMFKEAVEAALSVPVPSVVAPSLKVTVPVGVVDSPATIAVKVTDAPLKVTAALLLRVVVVACCTDCVTGLEAAPSVLASPG